MSEALGQALEQIERRLEYGMREAELELAEVRERCVRLEGEVRTIRAVLERTAPEVDDAPSAAVSLEPAASVPDDAEPGEAADVITIPPAAPETDVEPPEDPEAGPPDAEGDPSVPAYMPMLEELWEIARRDG